MIVRLTRASRACRCAACGGVIRRLERCVSVRVRSSPVVFVVRYHLGCAPGYARLMLRLGARVLERRGPYWVPLEPLSAGDRARLEIAVK